MVYLKVIFNMVKHKAKPADEPHDSQENDESKAKTVPLFSGISDAISDEALEDHKVAKVIAKTALSENKRLEKEIIELKNYKDQYYEKKEESAVLSTQINQQGESIGVRNLFFTIGGLLGGLLFVADMASYRLGFGIGCIACFIVAMLKPDFKISSFWKREK